MGPPWTRGAGRALGAATVAVLVTTMASPPGWAETRTAVARWDPLTGSAGDWSTTMQLVGAGFPTAEVASDSAGGAQVGVQTGQSTWFSGGTPPGQAYGSSRNQPYLNLRPLANNPGSPSTTTYTFERPTPLGWAFVLGDIDADAVTVSGTLADGSPASLADLGFQGTFNACDTPPAPGACPGPLPGDQPTWDPGSATLTGNPGATDSVGASGWFEPTAPLSSLTLTFRWRAGLPIFQTWFVSRTQGLTGTVSTSRDSGCDATEAEVRLIAPDGTVLARRSPAPDGSYEFPAVAATDDFSVVLAPGGPGCRVAGPDEVALDLTGGDDTADFELAGPAPPTPEVVGEVVDQDGDPVPGAELVLTDDDGDVVATDTTDGRGGYDLGPVPPGDYTLAIDPPPGFEVVGDSSVPVRVRPDGTLAGDVDFVLRETATAPSVPTVITSGVS